MILPSSVKRQRLNCGDCRQMGEGPYSENRLAASGRGAWPSKSTDSAGRILFRPTVHSNNGCAERTLPVNAICALLYIPGSHAVQWNTPGDILSCGGMRRRSPRVSAHNRSRCYTAPVTSPPSRRQARDQQRQRAPAEPNQRRPQMRRSGQRHPQAAADRKIGNHTHGTLRHQRQRNAGQRPACSPARAPRHLTLPSPTVGDWRSHGRGRGGDPPARADGPYRKSAQIAATVLICHSRRHACASSWQQTAAFGVSSY
jgi:hypothetical protein